MKTKNLLTAFLVMVFALNIDAQQIPNGGFEDWAITTTTDLDGFVTSNMMIAPASGNVSRVTDSYSSTYAAKLETVLLGTDTVAGMIILGNPGNQGISGGIPFVETPDSISLYVKYDIQPNDTAYFIVAFKNSGVFVQQPVFIQFAGTQSTYKRFSVATNLSALNPPDSMVAVITSSQMDPPQFVGSTLTIDSITFNNSVQQFPNNDFESWTVNSTSINPDSWSSFNNFSSYGIPELSFKTVDANSGNFALRVITDTATIPPPFGTNTLDTLTGYVFLGAPDMNNPGIPFAYRPISMEAYVKGTIVGGEAYIMATLSKWNTVTKVRDDVAFTMYYTASSIANYIPITMPFSYSLGVVPDTLDIRIMAGNVGSGGFIGLGNEFFVDDLSFTLPVDVKEINKDELTISIFPNPTSDKITVCGLEKADAIEIYSMLGEKVYTNNTLAQQTTIEIDLSSLPKGIYLVKVRTGTKFHIEKIIKQ